MFYQHDGLVILNEQATWTVLRAASLQYRRANRLQPREHRCNSLGVHGDVLTVGCTEESDSEEQPSLFVSLEAYNDSAGAPFLRNQNGAILLSIISLNLIDQEPLQQQYCENLHY